jgi:hypothetical protein
MQESMNVFPDQQPRSKKDSDKGSDARIPFPSPLQNSTGAMQSSRHSLPAPPRESRHARRTSLKDRIMAAGALLPSKHHPPPPPDSRPSFLSQGGRMPTSYPASSVSSAHRSSFYAGETDAEIEKKVMEMAGLGIRRSKENMQAAAGPPSFSRASSDNSPMSPASTPPAVPRYDMAMLRRVADTPANSKCADCGRRTKSSRWATQSECICSVGARKLTFRPPRRPDGHVPLHPMLWLGELLCRLIPNSRQHRGLGTHISKPRSVDLDNWAPESVLLAYTWGNERGNGVWEKLKPADVVPTDE